MDVQAYFDDILHKLFLSHAVSSFRILKQEFGDEEGFIRIRCILSDRSILEFAEYVFVGMVSVNVETYSYHWQDADGRLVKRWDNVPHHKEVDTFPHHLHLTENKVVGSTKVTLKKILDEIEKIIVHDE